MTSSEKPPPIGEAGRNVAANVERLRKTRGLSLQGLSDLLGECGRPILPTVLHRHVQGKRRTDADDLVAFAAVLGVTAGELLAPPDTAMRDPAADHPAIQAAVTLAARIGQLLADSGDREEAGAHSASVDRALRRVQIEIEELLAETGGPTGGRP